MERIDAVRATGLADLIVIEEYKGQKIDDILKYGVEIFAIGSIGKDISTISMNSAKWYTSRVPKAFRQHKSANTARWQTSESSAPEVLLLGLHQSRRL